MEEFVVLIDENDREVGVEEKLAAHQKRLRHRAFSVVLLNSRGEMLLQRRAEGKYHSGGLWSNTCCGHPRPGEPTAAAAQRRLMEEMGVACELDEIFAFAYEAPLDHGLVENEYDHVFLGRCDGLTPRPDPEEVADWRWADVDALWDDLNRHPERYTYWFKFLLEAYLEHREA